MNFWQRMSRTLRADAHGVIDALEDRVLLLKQHLREAELEVQRKQARCHALNGEEAQRKREAERLEAESLAHERDAELAVEAGEDALARFALSAWLSKREAAQRVHERVQVIDKERAGLVQALARQEPELEAMRARVTAFTLDQADAARGESERLPARAVAPERVEIELLRRKRAKEQSLVTGEVAHAHDKA